MGPNCIEIRCLWPSSEDSYPEVGLAKGIFVPEKSLSGKFTLYRVVVSQNPVSGTSFLSSREALLATVVGNG
jgi:hypothetical protein